VSATAEKEEPLGSPLPQNATETNPVKLATLVNKDARGVPSALMPSAAQVVSLVLSLDPAKKEPGCRPGPTTLIFSLSM